MTRRSGRLSRRLSASAVAAQKEVRVVFIALRAFCS